MKADEKTIGKVFDESTKFAIPDYQRPYTWDINNALQLFDDINEACEAGLKEYFIGSLVLIKNSDNLYDVVDGQQRLTTLTILFSSIMNALRDTGRKDHVRRKFVSFNQMTKEAEDCCLEVRSSDKAFYRSILVDWRDLSNTTMSESQEKMLINRNAFYDKLKDLTDIEIVKFEQYLEHQVQLVWVHVDDLSSAFRLFNVLNARGQPLSNSDLIKNNLLSQSKNSKERGDLATIWINIENEISKLGKEKLDLFFSHLRTSIIGKKQVDTLYNEFESMIKKSKIPIKEFAEQLLSSAVAYVELNKELTNSSNLNYKSLSRVFYDEWVSVMLCFLNLKKSKIDKDIFLIYLEKITYQNWLRGLGRTKRNQIYYDLISDLNSLNSKNAILKTFKKHSENNELKNRLQDNIYGRPFAKAFLLKIEDISQDKSVSKTYNNNEISIEHILPQTATDPYWINGFSDDERINFVNKIGNITLLSGRKNSAAQNYDFEKKKSIYKNKNKMVSFDMTKEVCELENWTKVEFEARQAKLTELLFNEFKLEITLDSPEIESTEICVTSLNPASS